MVGDHVHVNVYMSTLDMTEVLYANSLEKIVVGDSSVISAVSTGLLNLCETARVKIIAPPALAYGVHGANMLRPLMGVNTWDSAAFPDAAMESHQKLRVLNNQDIIIELEVVKVTTKKEYSIFACFESPELTDHHSQETCALSRLSEIDDITVEDDNENTLLMLSVRYQMLTLFAQILNSRPKEMSMADMVNVQKKSGHTALLYAVSNTKDEHSSVIKGLLKRGADPNLRVVSNGYSVLHYAAKIGTVEQVKLLLSWGGDPMSVTKNGGSVLDCAVDQPFHFRSKVMHYLNEKLDELYESEKENTNNSDL